jgi:serine/threonine-protein kinase HipA
MSTTEQLHAICQGRRLGIISWQRKQDKLSFTYDASWRADPNAFPLSLSMPFAAGEHKHDTVKAFLWGLLPDNDGVLKRWGERFNVSANNAFLLLKHVGEDCAGAVQLVQDDKAETLLSSSTTGRVKWLDESQLAERIQLLLRDHSASRMGTDQGHFSLAGAQPKTALLYDPKAGRWGVPSGSTPTTHILKPSTGDYDGYVENEHFCMALARALGFSVASSQVLRFKDTPVIVVERFDRRRIGSQVHRIHQEDMCQALGIMPHLKHQNMGGPTAAQILELIREHSSSREADAARFLDALILNWLIFGTDAHGKNYSFLIAQRGQTRLSPLYDISSVLPYPQQIYPRHVTLAMKVGSQYKIQHVGQREWKSAATQLGFDPTALCDRILELATAIPDTAAAVQKDMKSHGLNHGVIPRLVTALQQRSQECMALF